MLLDMGSTPIYSTLHGAIVQLGERLHGMQEVVGSSPISSIFMNKNRIITNNGTLYNCCALLPAG